MYSIHLLILINHCKAKCSLLEKFLANIDRKVYQLELFQIPIDREQLESVTLVVLVTDAKVPPIFTATTTVSIQIRDINDNTPIFVNPPADAAAPESSIDMMQPFTVLENATVGTRLSQKLEVRDPDQVGLSVVLGMLMDCSI